MAWDTANDAVLTEERRRLISDDACFDDVRVLVVDEHVWRHARKGEEYVTVIIDLTPVREGTGIARLLHMFEGRSKQVFETWPACRPKAWRKQIEVIVMDGFHRYLLRSLAAVAPPVSKPPLPRRSHRPRPLWTHFTWST